LAVISAHLVAGFGRIVDLSRDELLTDVSGCADLVASEPSAIDHMNDDHGEALSLYATKLLGMPTGDWRMTGADPDGIDLRAIAMRARLEFPERVRSAGDLRAVLARLAREARAKS
jgi:putative heme iron utilization protein